MDFLDELTAPKVASIKEKKNKDKRRGRVESPLLFKTKDETKYTFILDKYPQSHKLTQIRNAIERNGIKSNYQILYPLKIKAEHNDFTEGDTIVKFIKNNMFDLRTWIPRWSKIITMGRMLNCITESNQINLEGFYDTIMFNTNVFIPDGYNCQVFPIETYDRSIFTQSFENYFFKIQMEIAQEFELKPRRTAKKNCVYVEDTSQFFRDHMHETLVSTDIETYGLDWYKDKIGSIQFAFDTKTGYYLDWDNIDVEELSDFLEGKKLILHNGKFDGKFCVKNGLRRESFYIYADTMNMAHCINELRQSNLKGLQAFYTDHYGYDKELEEFKEKYPSIPYPDMPFPMRLKYGCYDVCVAMEIYEKMLEEIRTIDREYPLENGNTLESYYFNEVIPTVNNHMDSEMVGVNINVEELYRNGIYFHKKLQSLKDDIRRAFKITDKSINVSSAKQMTPILKKLGWKDQGVNKDKSYTMDNEALNKFIEAGHTEAQLILDLHTLETLMNGFVGYPKFKDQDDSEIDLFDVMTQETLIDEDGEEVVDTHKFNNFVFPEKLDMANIELGKGTGYWQHLKRVARGQYKLFPSFATCMAKSHRNKHRKPNLANIPSRGEYASRIRRIFSIPKDYVWVSADQAGLQLRNIAFLLEEGSPMRTAFLELGGDIHSMTGATVINNNRIPLEEFIARKKTDEEIALKRYKAKGQNFGCAFGAKAFTVMTTVIMPNWSEEECHDFVRTEKLTMVKDNVYLTVAIEILERHFKQYWGLKNYNEKRLREGKREGFVRSPYGTIRRTPYLLVQAEGDLDMKRYSNYESIALNSPIQSCEVWTMNRTLNRTLEDVKKLGLDASIPDFIHDAVECVCTKENLSTFCTILKFHAETIYPEYNGIPLEMEGNVADYWGTYRKTKIKDGKEVDAWEVWDEGHDWEKYIDYDLLEKLKERNNG